MRARQAGGRTRAGSRAYRPGALEGGNLRGRFSLITALYLALSALVASAMVQFLHDHSNALMSGDPPAPAQYLVLMVLDGARPDYFDVASLPHLNALRAQGTLFTNAFDGILESETPSGHTTLATGSTPARTGILGFDWAQNDSDYSIFSPDVVRSGAMEQIMAASHVPTIAGLYKASHPTARVVALSGHKYYAADPLGGPAADAIMYYQGDEKGRYVPVAIPGHTPPPGVLDAPGLIAPTTQLALGQEDALATRLAISAFRTMRQQITLINYPEFDWPLGHVDGGNADPKDVAALMQEFDRDLGEIEDVYRKAGVLDRTLFVITADHGMVPTGRFVPESVITNAVTRAGTTSPATSYSTGTFVWLKDRTRAAAVAQNILGAHDPGIQSVYYFSGGRYVLAGGSLAGGAVEGAEEYLLATLVDGHEPDVVAFCKEGQTSADPSTHWKADHGGASWQSQHIPLLLSGEGVQSGQTVADPAQLEDVAPTALAAMGVQPTGMEGHVLTEAVPAANGAEVAARRAELDRISPLVDALVAQDSFEAAQR